MSLRRATRTKVLAATTLAVLGLTSCGGGGGGGGSSADALGACNKFVLTSTITDPAIAYTDTGGAGGGDSGGGGDGGGGGAEGQFRNALLSVEQADGVKVGEAVVDDTLGMVRFRLCGYAGPLKFTIRAKADGTTTYYDEGKEATIPFPPGEEIHAVVPAFTKNVGVTPLTEAAYVYVTTKYGLDGWRTASNVREANELVRSEFNRLLPAALQIEDVTRLPWTIGDKTPAGSIPDTKNGLYGLVNGGLARAAALFNVGDIQPALTLSRQIGKDLVDGKLDLFANNTPVLTPATNSQATYNAHQIRDSVNSGIGQVAARLGNRNANAAVIPFTQVKFVDPARSAFTVTSILDAPMFLLRKDGAVYFWPRRDQPMTRFDTNYRQLYSALDFLGSKRDGQVLTMPKVEAAANEIPRITSVPVVTPQLAGNTTLKENDPTLIAGALMRQNGVAFRVFRNGTATSTGVSNVIDLGVAAEGTRVAFSLVKSDGRVYTWGDAGCLAVGGALADPLGLGRTPASCAPVADPQLNPTLADIIAVTGHEAGGFAIDRTQRVWGWGQAASNGLVTSNVPVLIDTVNKLGPILQLECATAWQCIALTPGGGIIAWGVARDSQGSPTTPFPPTLVTLPAGRRGIYIGSAGFLVYGLLDDGQVVVISSGPSTPQLINAGAVAQID